MRTDFGLCLLTQRFVGAVLKPLADQQPRNIFRRPGVAFPYRPYYGEKFLGIGSLQAIVIRLNIQYRFSAKLFPSNCSLRDAAVIPHIDTEDNLIYDIGSRYIPITHSGKTGKAIIGVFRQLQRKVWFLPGFFQQGFRRRDEIVNFIPVGYTQVFRQMISTNSCETGADFGSISVKIFFSFTTLIPPLFVGKFTEEFMK